MGILRTDACLSKNNNERIGLLKPTSIGRLIGIRSTSYYRFFDLDTN